jgi:HD-like signal output (HDOD) protein
MIKELDLEQAKALVGNIDIPVRPVVLQKIMELQERDDFDIGEIAKAISSDVSLSAGVLKTVNSPLYGLKNKISSILQAVSLLGLNNVMNLVISISLRLEVRGNFNKAVERFWDTANDVALISAGLAKTLSNTTPDEAYTLGLFHDCGLPLLMLKDDGYLNVLKQANSSYDKVFTAVEDEAMSTNHAVVGFYVAKSWRIPQRIRLGILNHHEPDMLSSDDHELNNLIANLKMAEAMSHAARRVNDHPEWERIQDDVLGYLSMSEFEFDELKEEMIEQLNEAA